MDAIDWTHLRCLKFLGLAQELGYGLELTAWVEVGLIFELKVTRYCLMKYEYQLRKHHDKLACPFAITQLTAAVTLLTNL